MIAALRQRHRRMFAVLGMLVPIAFGLGIAARRPVPSVQALPAELAQTRGEFNTTVWERNDLFAKSPVATRLLREGKTGRFGVTLTAGSDFLKPDLIVYWVAGNPAVTNSLPDDARLLGTFGTAALALPADATTTDGKLVLYSLADNEIVDVSKPTRFNDSTK